MEIKTRGIVLRTVKYGDSRLIVDMLTAKTGRVSFICTFSKSNKGKIKQQMLQPLSVLDVVFDNRPNVELQHFRDLRVAVSFISMPFDPYKLSISFFLSEFLSYATRGEQESEPLEEFIENSLLWLDNATEGFANFHIVFMIHITLFIGFYPNLDNYEKGDWFDLRDGSFSSVCPRHPDYLGPEEAAILRQLMRMNFNNMRFFRMSRDERNRCTEIILSYYRLHVPNFPELKSLNILKTLF